MKPRDQVAEPVAPPDPLRQHPEQCVIYPDLPFRLPGMHLGQRPDVLVQVVEQRYALQYQVEGYQAGDDESEHDAQDHDLAGGGGLSVCG